MYLPWDPVSFYFLYFAEGANLISFFLWDQLSIQMIIKVA